MNHDYAHCLDCSHDCPDKCFRKFLTCDLIINRDVPNAVLAFAYSWAQFKGTDECKIEQEENNDPNSVI